MQILTAVQNPKPDYVALAMVLALAAIVAIMVIRKHHCAKRKTAEPVQTVLEQEPVAEKPIAPGSAGGVKLHGVEPKIAAMLMAIVADKTNKPLNELRFISIKEVE